MGTRESLSYLVCVLLYCEYVLCSLTTPWTEDVGREPWPEYPRPTLVREDWLSLNGLWSYAITDREETEVTYDGDIMVPYCVESLLSGVESPLSPEQYLWYSRIMTVPQHWLDGDTRVILHFQAVDYQTEVFVNSQHVVSHQGGFDSFSVDITDALLAGEEASPVVRVWDPSDTEPIPVGKQKYNNTGLESLIFYTPCSGIWQTVWLEPVPAGGWVGGLMVETDIDEGTLHISADIFSATEENLLKWFKVSLNLNGTEVKVEGSTNGSFNVTIELPMDSVELWSPANPVLYDMQVIVGGDLGTLETVTSYAGIRKVEKRLVGKFERFFLNNELLPFQLGPLDQGYWPDGIFSPPTEEAMVWDLLKTKELGFNMVRKHMKVECERWYYWTDKLGLLVWQDFPAVSHHYNMENFITAQQVFEDQWRRWVGQRNNHPSIVLWVVFNEAWGQHQTVEVTNKVMAVTPTRWITPVSGWVDAPAGHVRDHHVYPGPCQVDYACLPSVQHRISVVGELWGRRRFIPGHNWFGDDWSSLGMTEEEFYAAYSHTLDQLQWAHDTHWYSAAVFTQTTDVEGEINGFFTYDRMEAKINTETIRNMNQNFTQAITEAHSSP